MTDIYKIKKVSPEDIDKDTIAVEMPTEIPDYIKEEADKDE